MLCASIGTLSQFFSDIPTLRPGFDSYSSVNLIIVAIPYDPSNHLINLFFG